MIASAMQIMNMIAFAMGPCSTKASPKRQSYMSIFVRCAENAENATVCVICVSVPCVSRFHRGFWHEISELREGVNAGRLAAHALVACDEAQRYLA